LDGSGDVVAMNQLKITVFDNDDKEAGDITVSVERSY
jgi:hypothetical protein